MAADLVFVYAERRTVVSPDFVPFVDIRGLVEPFEGDEVRGHQARMASLIRAGFGARVSSEIGPKWF